CEWSAYSGTVVSHVPLPGLFRPIVEERRMKARRGSVLEEEGDRISGDRPAASALGWEGRRGGVVHPHARVFASLGIASEENHGFVGGTAIRRALARYLVHLNVLAAKQPLEVHIMDRLLARDGAAQYPMPHQAWKERVGRYLLCEHRCGRAQ